MDHPGGAVVPPGNAERLAAAVLDVPDNREPMGAAARVAARRFSADRYTELVEELTPA